MKRLVLGCLVCGLAGAAAGVAWAGPPPKQNSETDLKVMSALGHLRQARDALQDAAPDKDGHRKKAVDLILKAIKEVEESSGGGHRHHDDD